MEKLKVRYHSVQNALARLKEDLDILQNTKNQFYLQYHRQFRNSAIQSFEFSIDTFWKFLKDFLNDKYKVSIQVPTPRAVFRELVLVNLISADEFENFSKLIADRNLTSHSYNELLAEEIAIRLPQYHELMQNVLKRI